MADAKKVRKKRALSSEGARWVRQNGHNDALEFAIAIGLKQDYQNDQKAKKDVIDLSGDAHSVKGGKKKWQVFLYRQSRFESDDAFQVMDGIGTLLIDCIKAFPESFSEYEANKQAAKERLRIPMRALQEKLSDSARLRAFLNKSFFNGDEVKYLSIKHNDKFHIFLNKDIIDVLNKNITIANSRAIRAGDTAEQKVLFKYENKNLGEIEMRNDTKNHYREVRFNMSKPRFMKLLFENIKDIQPFGERTFVYGSAIKTFGRWKK